MDFAGTGKYSSEYIVSSYGVGNLDMHFGLGWGILSGSQHSVKNPFGYLKESFYTRQGGYSGDGGLHHQNIPLVLYKNFLLSSQKGF